MSDNLRIWNAVSKTNPAYTKKVNQRGGFTAISAHYQIMAATEQFGPLGEGWGYDTTHPIEMAGLVTVGVTLWHGSRDNKFGPVWGGAELLDSRGKVDSDATKKAGTDGLTKALSQLGFNADVFLGRFDDNKYVAEMTREFAAQDNAPSGTIADDQRDIIQTLAAQAGVSLKTICESYSVKALPELAASKFDEVKRRLDQTIQDKKQEKVAA